MPREPRKTDHLVRTIEEAALTIENAFESRYDFEDLTLQELEDLVDSVRVLKTLSERLDGNLRRVEEKVEPGFRFGGFIQDAMHPVIQMILQQRKKTRDRAARIRRSFIGEAKEVLS